MPTSWNIFDEDTRFIIGAIQPRWVLDVGAGMGKVADMVREICPDAIISGVEAHRPYIELYKLADKYTIVYNMDAKKIPKTFPDREWDLVIFGDVLEHMTRSAGMDLFHYMLYVAKYILIVSPIGYKQGAAGGVEWERHVSSWHPNEFHMFTDVIQNFAMAENDGETRAIAFQCLVRGYSVPNKEWKEVARKWQEMSQRRSIVSSAEKQPPGLVTN